MSLQTLAEQYAGQVLFVGIEMEDNSGNPVTRDFVVHYAAAKQWNDVIALADPLESMFSYAPQPAVPLYIAVDAKTMRILALFNGGFSSQSSRIDFVEQNLAKTTP